MLIGILQTGHALDEVQSRLGDYDAMFQRLLGGRGFEFATWNVVDMEFPNSVNAADGWLITGSKHGVYEDHPWIDPLEQFVRRAYMEPVPMVGVCFGHQIIARAMGGVVEKSDKGWGVGRQSYLYGNEKVSLNVWHQDQVIVPPATASTVAANKFCEHAGLLYGDRMFSVQAHPEFGAEMMQMLINLRGKSVPEERLAYAQKVLNEPIDDTRLAEDIGDFFLMDRTSNAPA